MNTSEAQLVEKPKRKSKPRVDRYSQNEAFAVMLMAFLIMFLFGFATSLNTFKTSALPMPFAVGITAFLALVFFFLLGRWNILPKIASGILAIISVVAILASGTFIFILAWLIIITIFVIVPIAFLSLTVSALYLIAKLGNCYKTLNALHIPMIVLSLALLPCVANIILVLAYLTRSMS